LHLNFEIQSVQSPAKALLIGQFKNNLELKHDFVIFLFGFHAKGRSDYTPIDAKVILAIGTYNTFLIMAERMPPLTCESITMSS
jgi:hypothetical protein